MESLRVSLETYYADIVKSIALVNDIPEAEEGTKTELLEQLVQTIPRRAAEPQRVAALTETERAALAFLLEAGGQARLSDLAVSLALSGLVRLENVEEMPRTLPTTTEVLMPLLRQGWVVNLTPPVSQATRRNFSPLHEIAIPPEVVRALPKKLLQVPEPNPELLLAAPPKRVEQQPISEILRTLFFIWAELRREPASALKAGGIYKRDAQRLARSLNLSFSEHEERIRFFVDLLMKMRLLAGIGDEVRAVEAEEALRFWEQSSVSQVSELLSTILEALPELDFDLSPLQFMRRYVYFMIQPRPVAALCTEILRRFECVQENMWFPLDVFQGLLNGGRTGTFLIKEESLIDLYQRLRWYGMADQFAVRKERLEEAMLMVERHALVRLLEHLRSLGVVMLGYDEEEDLPTAVRPTPLVHAALTGRPYEEIGERVGQIILQPDFQLLAMGPVSLKTLLYIEFIAEREKVQPAAVAYRITRESVYRALQAGETLSTVLQFLEEVTEVPVPQNVERTLREWGAQHERIVLRQPVLVIQVDSPERLQALQEDPTLGKALHPLDATTAWVPSHSALKVERRLWELEMLPTLSGGREADLPHSLRWNDEDGTLYPRHPLPSLYVTGTVERFAEPDGAGWRLSPGSVRQAVAAGLEVPEMIELLETMLGAQLSPKWEKRLKAWGGHYGDAQTARVRLLRFETAEALTELRQAERRLHRRLRPVGGEDGALAVVEEKHWEEVCALLEEWGIDVEESTWW
ncbi:MAG: helicase-associated domain-containing protein [Anaerolineae bacterium]